MNIAKLGEEIFDALREFDQDVRPFGLYAARDVLLQPNPSEVVRPFLDQMKAREHCQDIKEFYLKFADVQRWSKLNTSYFSFFVPDFGSVSLRMARTSKIKVRQYGSRYHLDKHENPKERWRELQLDEAIPKLCRQQADNDWQMLLFVGFDKAQRPFERELSELKAHQTCVSHGIEFFEQTWDDAIGRGFKIKAGLWAHQK